MLNYNNFMCRISLICENIAHRVGFTDTIIINFDYGYKPEEMHNETIILTWCNGDYEIDTDFYEGEDYYNINYAYSLSEIHDIISKYERGVK